MDDRAATYDQHKDRESTRKPKLQSIVEDELAEPGQIDTMMSSSSASAIQPIIQAYEKQTTQNLRGALGPKGKTQGSQASASSTEALLVGAPPVDTSFEPQEINRLRQTKIEDLMDLANNLRSQLESVGEANDEDIAKYNKNLITMKSQQYQLRAFMTSADKSPENLKKYSKLKNNELIVILKKPL
jgi:hypothetical protein